MNPIRDEFIHRLLVDSGIKNGMRILDVGCGSGDLSIIASEIMEDQGEVIGFDLSEAALEKAKQIALDKQLKSVKFIQADILSLPESLGYFDAIIGRRVLMYQNDPLESINRLLSHLKVGGIIIFQESDCMASSFIQKSMPLHTKLQSWIWDTVQKEGGNIHIGSELYSIAKWAGLMLKNLRSEAVLVTCESGDDLAWIAKMMLPRMIEYKVASIDDINIDTLAQRLQLELEVAGTPFVRDITFGLCAEKIQ